MELLAVSAILVSLIFVAIFLPAKPSSGPWFTEQADSEPDIHRFWFKDGQLHCTYVEDAEWMHRITPSLTLYVRRPFGPHVTFQVKFKSLEPYGPETYREVPERYRVKLEDARQLVAWLERLDSQKENCSLLYDKIYAKRLEFLRKESERQDLPFEIIL